MLFKQKEILVHSLLCSLFEFSQAFRISIIYNLDKLILTQVNLGV